MRALAVALLLACALVTVAPAAQALEHCTPLFQNRLWSAWACAWVAHPGYQPVEVDAHLSLSP